MDKLIFCIAHHSDSNVHTELLSNCIMSIREYYPFNKIIIVKTSTSNIPYSILDDNIYVYNKYNDNTFIIGVLPTILDILKEGDNYILIHDSMYLINKLPSNILYNEFYSLWNFDKDFNFTEVEFNELLDLINIEYPEKLREIYKKYGILWRGCFGPAFGGNYNFLKKLETILNIEDNQNYYIGRNKLLLSERFIPVIIEYIRMIDNSNYNTTQILCLNGSIYDHPNSFMKNENISSAAIKKLSKVNNYNKYFFKLWFSRN